MFHSFLNLRLLIPSILLIVISSTFMEAKSPEKVFENSKGIKFVLIPAGKFLMGAPDSDTDKKKHETPQHEVTISKAFYLSETEVTQSQWRAVMTSDTWKQTASYLDDGPYGEGPDFPVYYVSFNDIQEFIKRLQVLEPGKKYRLPTEAEWEYAARAGSTTRYYYGDNKYKLGEYAWYLNNSKETTHKVKGKKPNPWGLYDMYGNVWEWVSDYDADGEDGYTASPKVDPSSSGEGGAIRRKRGGSWWKKAENCRSSTRGGQDATYREDDLGFRLLLEISN